MGNAGSALLHLLTAYSEGNEQYIEHMRNFGFFDPTLLGDAVKIFTLASLSTQEEPSLATTIAHTIRQSGAKVVLLDGFQGAELLLPEQQRMREVLSTLAIRIRYLDVTLLITLNNYTLRFTLNT